jgi:serine/threonine protein kinase
MRTEGSEILVLATGGTDLTTTPRKRGSLVGSEDYVAPEIIAGKASGPAADLWSLGVLIYLFLSGISPFKGFNQQETF